VSTLSRSPLGLLLSCPETRDLLAGVMGEVMALARQNGVALDDRVLAESIVLAESYSPTFRCSMLNDLDWRRPLEIEALNGMVVGLGKKLKIETPLNFAIHACLKLENYKILNPFWMKRLER
jgi:2-dehydropantoate 2-reductase